MITPKIKALFRFIDYLHSNIENFKQYDEVTNELHLLDKERKQVSPRKNFKDKLKYDKLQAEIEDKFNVIKENIITPIQTRAIELNVCDPNRTETLHNWNISEISQLKENFNTKDLPEILNNKNKYIELRTKVKSLIFLGFFIDHLDEIIKILVDFFNDTDQNEFEAFETKTIRVNDISEAVEIVQAKTSDLRIPNRVRINSHEALYRAIIFSANEEVKTPISGAYEVLKEVWFFLNSDSATFNGKDIEKNKRPLFVNPVMAGKPEFDEFFEAEITYCSTQNRIKLKEQDFVTDITNWIENKSKEESTSIPRKRKFSEFLDYIKGKNLPPQQTTTENDSIRYTAKHYVLTYLIECKAKGQELPIGQKKELEQIGNEKMGVGKGNRFYKVFNEIVRKDLGAEKNLIEIGGENWRTIVKHLSGEPETIEAYLQNKQL